MKIELKKLRQPDGKVWYAVKVNNDWQSPFHLTESEARIHYDKIIASHQEGLPEEETILSEEL